MRILLVCLGNICRSPTAEAALRAAIAEAGLSDRVEVDSAGTGDWHLGKPPDARMTQAAAAAGITLTGAARQVRTAADLAPFDLVLAMDRQNLADLLAIAGDDAALRGRIRLYRDFESPTTPVRPTGPDVPDPYYGPPDGFAQVVEIVRSAARGVVVHVRSELEAP
jgi:protein-tyrosine phosphatase